MPKRKDKGRSQSETEAKITKLEKKLAKYRKQSEGEGGSILEIEPEDDSLSTHCQILDPEMFCTENKLDENRNADIELISNVLESDEAEELDTDFLSALGEHSNVEKQYGEKIHEEIHNIVKNILIEGLPKKKKDIITESILIPSNCKLLDAPKLNLELVSVLSNPSKIRDNVLQDRQQELGLAIASICQVINDLSRKEVDKLNIIKKLSDVSRILSNSHHQYTEIRRKLINPVMDRNLTEGLKENKRETYLYTNLEDSLKSFSAMKRASNALKSKVVTTQSKSMGSKNFQQPSRRLMPNLAHPGRGSYRGGQQRFQPRPSFKPQDNRQFSTSIRGRARYP